MLLGQQRGRHQHDHLLAVLHGLERGADRDLGLAVADVAGDHPVHRDRLLHVGLDLVDGGQLVGRLGVGEGVLELALPGRVRAKAKPGRGRPSRVQLNQLGGDLPDRLARPALGLGPVGAAQLVQRRHLAADVAGQQVERIGRDEQPVAGLAALARGVLDDQVLAGRPAGRAAHHVDVLADAVLGVHHVIAGLERERVDRRCGAGPAASWRCSGAPPRLPVRSVSVITARFAPVKMKPSSSRPRATVTMPAFGASGQSARLRRRRPGRPRRSARRPGPRCRLRAPRPPWCRR